MLSVALAIAHEVAKLTGKNSEDLGSFSPASVAQSAGLSAEAIHAVAKELVQYKGRGLVVAKDHGTKGLALQNVVNFLNSALANEGETLDGISLQYQGSHAEFERLLNAARTGAVKTLVIADVNPAYHYSDTLKVKEALKKVPNLVYFGSYIDETADLAKFVAAESHPFEVWGDSSPRKEIYSIQQPTIRPLWKTRSLLESLLVWRGKGGQNPMEASYQEVLKTAKDWHSRSEIGRAHV